MPTAELREGVPSPGGQSVPVTVLDAPRWRRNALWLDMLALGVLLLSGIALGVDLFFAGRLTAAESLKNFTFSSWGALQAGLGFVAFVLSFAWVSARLVTLSAREARGG